jgi:phage terminase large subunit-like protein
MLPAQQLAEWQALRRVVERHDACGMSRLFSDSGDTARGSYPKHLQFFAEGATHHQRLFLAANRVGKTTAGGYEVACHLTGRYPAWWPGRRYTQAGDWWCVGTTSETTRDVVQAVLLGRPDGDGGYRDGMLPPDAVLHVQGRSHGLAGAVEAITVKHASGRQSRVQFKSYEQGRAAFEGTSRQGVWCDEEPPEGIYTECLYRTATTDGIVFLTFTPLQGMSAVVASFLQADEATKRVKACITAGWDDVPHLSEAMKAALLATTPPYQRDARTKGTPSLGAGAIYAVPESEIVVPDFALPAHYRRCFGFDAGGGRNATAAVWLAIDPSDGVAYLYSEYRRESPEIALHAAAIKARGAWIPGAGDAAGLMTTATDAEQIVSAYTRAGVPLVVADKAVESGIQAVWERLSAGTLKVFASCQAWREEFRLYHRDERGRVVKRADHLMDATRYAVYSGVPRACVAPVVRESRVYRPAPSSALSWMG